MDALESLRGFLVVVLHQLRPDAELTELTAAPPDHYTLRIGLPPGDVSKEVVLARELVERAQSNVAAFRSFRLILTGHLARHRARRAVDDARAARHGTTALRICPECHAPIAGSDVVVVRRARYLHRACDPRSSRPA